MRKKSTITSFILPALLISGFIIVLVSRQKEQLGELILSKEHIDFGAIPEWEGLVAKTVIARNAGRNAVQVQRIQAGSRYVEIKGPTVLQPQQEETFQVVLNPEMVPRDRTVATAVLFTNSRKTPLVYLTIVASVRKFATLSHEICDFGEIEPETGQEKKVELCVNAPINRDAIRFLPSNHPELTWEMVTEAGSDCFPITIRMGPLRDRGLFSSMLTVAFPNGRTLPLPVSARLVGLVKVQPETIFYGAVNREPDPSAEFTLSAKTPFRVLEIQAPEFLRVTNSPKTISQNQKTMKISWDTSNSPTLLREEIRVKTSADPLPIRIPIYGFIRSETLMNSPIPQTDEQKSL